MMHYNGHHNRTEELDSCAQEFWALYPNTVGEFLELEEEQMLFAGKAVGYGIYDDPVNQLKTERADMGKVVTFQG